MHREPATIVILAWNEWASTRACLDSMRPTLRPGDQVVVVDNGSTDQTPRGLQRYPWAEVLTNDENRGFAAGCNQGAGIARNDVVVFLNNDTLPVGQWLDALLEPFEDETIAATGSRSNFVSGPQLVPTVDYATPRRAEVCRFERDWRRQHQGEISDVERLVGFCLAVRRDAFEAVGGFDEDFGLGGFEDDDLCTRLRGHGHRLAIAHGSFVHHDGHKTFDANGLDWFELQQENRARYLTKHGRRRTVEAAATQPADEPSESGPVRISACLIVRDEQDRLDTCLDSIAAVVDEIVVHDTGSTDDSVEIARRHGATVIEGHWDDDFALARNVALEACTGTWILQIDADEELVVTGDLRSELAGVDALLLGIDNVGTDGRAAFAHSAIRLFRRDRGSWEGRLHERVVARPGQPQLRIADSATVSLRHWGYSPDSFDAKDKFDRNVRVARAEVAELGAGDGRTLVNLARALGAADQHDEAIATFEQALALTLDDVNRRLALRALVSLLVDQGRFQEALTWLDRLRPLALDGSIVAWLEALARIGLGDVDAGVALLTRIDTVRDGDGYTLPTATVLAERARVLADAQRWDEVLQSALDGSRISSGGVPWALAATACAELGDDASTLTAAVTETELVEVAGKLLTAPPAAADLVLEALWSRFPKRAPLLAGAVRLGPELDVDRALEWSARLREAGLDSSCPLVAIARDQRRNVTDRLQAAAVVAATFEPERAEELLAVVAVSVAEESFADVLISLDALVPALLPTLVALLASTPARCRSLGAVLTQFGATDEATIVTELGVAMEADRSDVSAVIEPEPSDDRPGDAGEVGPGVFVLGMHRSGTSAVARVVNLLGPRCADEDDLMPPDDDQNPKGFWESTSLTELNDALLADLGGSWSAPPCFPSDDATAGLVAKRGASALEAFERSHGSSGGWVWKDPRNCMTFPFWAAVLPTEPVVILPYRNPLEVWRSLETRNELTKAHAFALWERYTLGALRAAAGRPTLVSRYDALLDDPGSWCTTAASFLQANGVAADAEAALPEVEDFLEQGLRHATASTDDLEQDPDLTPSQRALWELLDGAQGAHESFDPGPLAPETFWVDPLLDALGRATSADTTPAEAGVGALSVPPCSIIIPLFNKVEYTQRCLESLIENTDDSLYELVLVDNGSTDGTEALLQMIEGDVVIIRNERNLGYAVACNQGARAARGEHLLFLNNDTEAHPGWLPPLLDALENDPVTVAVGSRLLFPNGTIQHAGVFVAEDHRPGQPPLVPFHRSYRAPAEHPDVMRATPMSVLTGAALLVRRSAFFEAGAYDEGFWNGYEDVDLCFKLRERGGLLGYEPRSCLIHHESVSGSERFTSTEQNTERLVERWAGRIPADVVIDESGAQTIDGKAALKPIGARPLADSSPSRRHP